MAIGNCKHGRFELTKGCPECIVERQAVQEKETADVNSPDNIAKRIKETEEAVAGKEVPRLIVKVQYVDSSGIPAKGREYSYFTAEPLAVGDKVQVPVYNRVQSAVVTAIDVPESEIAAFRDKVKTIPAGSKLVDQGPPTQAVTVAGKIEDTEPAIQPPLVSTEEPIQELPPGGLAEAARTAGAEVKVVSFGAEGKPAALVTIETQVGKPRNDLFVLYQEAAGLLQVAEKRVIVTNEDLEPATDDLAIILTCRKAMEARKTEIAGPLKVKLDLVNQAFKDIMFPVMEADRLTRGKVNDFGNEQRRKAAEAQRIEDEKLKLAKAEATLTGTGEHTQELGTAVAPPPVPERTRTNLGTLGGRSNWKAHVVDFKLLPDVYKLPNETVLNSFARSTKGTTPIPGVEFWNDRIITIRGK